MLCQQWIDGIPQAFLWASTARLIHGELVALENLVVHCGRGLERGRGCLGISRERLAGIRFSTVQKRVVIINEREETLVRSLGWVLCLRRVVY